VSVTVPMEFGSWRDWRWMIWAFNHAHSQRVRGYQVVDGRYAWDVLGCAESPLIRFEVAA
jgi:hypothetical protein